MDKASLNYCAPCFDDVMIYVAYLTAFIASTGRKFSNADRWNKSIKRIGMKFFGFIVPQATIYLFVLFALVEELNPHYQHILFPNMVVVIMLIIELLLISVGYIENLARWQL